jgi:2,5-dihydroxypyridine 5,6-dioxygenase
MVQFPLSPLVAGEAMVLFREELVLCNLRRTERVLIISDSSTNPHYAAACFGAALSLDAEAAQVVVPFAAGTPETAARRRTEKMVPYEHIIDLMQQVEFVADLTSRGFLHSERQVEMLSRGMRMLRVREPLEMLQRLFPTRANQERVEAGARSLDGGQRLEVTTPAGTALTVDRGDRPVFTQYGYAERPGRWDHWPTAQVVVAPAEETARGTIVLVPGDIIASRYVSGIVRLVVEGGRIVQIDGEGIDAVMLRDHFARGFGTDADRISHIGWGCDPRASYDTLLRYAAYRTQGAEVRSVYGAVTIAFGSNADLGGQNQTQLHLDLGLRGARFAMDGRPLVEKEAFLLPELR